MDNLVSVETVITHSQPVLNAFYDAVVACGRSPPFKPTIRVANKPGATLYDPASRAVVLVPYEVLPTARRAAMDRFAAIGTLGLSGREQYSEVFNNLLVPHELGHWLQKVCPVVGSSFLQFEKITGQYAGCLVKHHGNDC